MSQVKVIVLMSQEITKKRFKTDILFYDGLCPLCSAEVNKLSQYTKDKVLMLDLHTLPDSISNPTKSELKERLHLRDTAGIWYTGLDANVKAWQHTPYRYLWRALNWPVVRLFSEAGYELWLKWRARRTCSVGEPKTR